MDVHFENGKPVFFPYTPSKEAGWAFVGLFGLASVAHVVYMFPMRAWYFIPLIVGGICETFGYYGRVWASEDVHKVKPFILQVLLILAAPAWLCATIYMTLGRIIRILDAGKYSMIRITWLTKIYVLIDIIVFFTQIGGAGIQASGDPQAMAAGNKAILGGLIFQLFAFCFFILITWRVHMRLNREPTEISRSLNWKKYMHAIYATSVAIFVRSLVRAIEYAAGSGSVVAQHEAFIYIFDAFLMWFVMMVMLIVHPGQLIKTAMRRMEGIYSGNEMRGNDHDDFTPLRHKAGTDSDSV